MSGAFKNAKRKLSQSELRKYMNEHKSKLKEKPKIDSPLAKYNELGQLTCILCQSIVRAEAVWSVHVNSKQHKEKIERAKKLKESTNNFTTPLKRPLTPPLIVPEKKLKSILKNGSSNTDETISNAEPSNSSIPADFFDNSSGTNNNVNPIQPNDQNEKMEVDVSEDNTIPEGFFDDPKQDAKARNIDYKDPIEEEWEKFQKAIRDADNESAAIIAEDQEEATNERQIDEIDEQMKNWSRVLSLERKKTEVITTVNKEIENMDNSDATEDEADIDEYLDWRSKKSFRA